MSAVLMLIASCVKPPNYPIEPQIEFISFSQTTIQEQQDSFYVTFSFTDGDGDLGWASEDNDTTDIFFLDTRINAVTTVKLPFIPQQGVGNGISGEVRILMLPTRCAFQNPPVPTQELIYTLYINDRAGNSSNVLTLPPLTVVCN